MKKPKNSLIYTNKYLKKQKNIEEYIALSTSTSTLVEGVKIRNPLMTAKELGVKLRVKKPNCKSLWD